MHDIPVDGCVKMKKRLPNREFLKIFELLWQIGPKIGYKNPESWRSFPLSIDR
jgi:hypothetical protein